MRAIHLTAFGNPAQSLEFLQIKEPAAPSPGQALIGVEFSPIDLSDLLVVSGAYVRNPCRPRPSSERKYRSFRVGAAHGVKSTPSTPLAVSNRGRIPAESSYHLRSARLLTPVLQAA
jgi:hypothetical protein